MGGSVGYLQMQLLRQLYAKANGVKVQWGAETTDEKAFEYVYLHAADIVAFLGIIRAASIIGAFASIFGAQRFKIEQRYDSIPSIVSVPIGEQCKRLHKKRHDHHSCSDFVSVDLP
jgi:hypothetical protein